MKKRGMDGSDKQIIMGRHCLLPLLYPTLVFMQLFCNFLPFSGVCYQTPSPAHVWSVPEDDLKNRKEEMNCLDAAKTQAVALPAPHSPAWSKGAAEPLLPTEH